MAMQLPPIVDTEGNMITCPSCEKVQEAQMVLYEGAPFWSRVHECINCHYTIMESEWETASDEQIEIAALKHQLALLTAVAQEAWQLPIDHQVNHMFARAVMNAVAGGAFRPRGE